MQNEDWVLKQHFSIKVCELSGRISFGISDVFVSARFITLHFVVVAFLVSNNRNLHRSELLSKALLA